MYVGPAHHRIDSGRTGFGKCYADAYNLAAPEQFLGELRVDDKSNFPVLFTQEDMDVFPVRWNRDEDFSAHPE